MAVIALIAARVIMDNGLPTAAVTLVIVFIVFWRGCQKVYLIKRVLVICVEDIEFRVEKW